MRGVCNYADPGTYGHECGNPAIWACAGKSGFFTRFFAVRCDECKYKTGPDNAGLSNWAAYNPEIHRNEFMANRWPNPPEFVSYPA